jgi:glutamyl-tRNA reductase
MSGSNASQALQERFDAIRRAELSRLRKKLAGLTDDDRAFVHQVTTEIVDALARGPRQALADDSPTGTVEALVRLFALDA